jgi:hypothetical protein
LDLLALEKVSFADILKDITDFKNQIVDFKMK